MEALHVSQLSFTINTNLKVCPALWMSAAPAPERLRKIDASLESVYFRVKFVSKQNRKISSNVFLTYLALYNTNLIKSSKTVKKNFSMFLEHFRIFKHFSLCLQISLSQVIFKHKRIKSKICCVLSTEHQPQLSLFNLSKVHNTFYS